MTWPDGVSMGRLLIAATLPRVCGVLHTTALPGVGFSVSIVFALGACGGSKFSSPDEVAKHLDCTDVKHSQEPQTSGSVTCTFHGDHVIVSWFDSEDQENAFKLAAEQLGDPIIYGSRWAIWCTRAETCEAAKKAMSSR